MVEVSFAVLLTIALVSKNISAVIFSIAHIIYSVYVNCDYPNYFLFLAVINYVLLAFTPSNNPFKYFLFIAILIDAAAYIFGCYIGDIALFLNCLGACFCSRSIDLKLSVLAIGAAIIVALGLGSGHTNGMVRTVRSSAGFRVHSRAFGAVNYQG